MMIEQMFGFDLSRIIQSFIPPLSEHDYKLFEEPNRRVFSCFSHLINCRCSPSQRRIAEMEARLSFFYRFSSVAELDMMASIFCMDLGGHTDSALRWAVEIGDHALVRRLCRNRKVRPHVFHNMPLKRAAELGHLQIIKELMLHPLVSPLDECRNKLIESSTCALQIACQCHQDDAVMLMVRLSQTDIIPNAIEFCIKDDCHIAFIRLLRMEMQKRPLDVSGLIRNILVRSWYTPIHIMQALLHYYKNDFRKVVCDGSFESATNWKIIPGLLRAMIHVEFGYGDLDEIFIYALNAKDTKTQEWILRQSKGRMSETIRIAMTGTEEQVRALITNKP